ncbi:MAG: hypothetical protein JO131_10250, partial [Gammaproteobacteria bacterium]|nr:hypothetical protein [Gammaproteobacteria bacterium]
YVISNLGKETGYKLNVGTGTTRKYAKIKNYEKFVEHTTGKSGSKSKSQSRSKESTHNYIVAAMETAYKTKWKSDVQKIIETVETKIDEGIYKVTSNMFRLVYAEIILNIPFNNHKTLVELMEMNGVAMGTMHRERTSMV